MVACSSRLTLDKWAHHPRFPVLVSMGLFNTVSLPSGNPSSFSCCSFPSTPKPDIAIIPPQPLLLHPTHVRFLQTLLGSPRRLLSFALFLFSFPSFAESCGQGSVAAPTRHQEQQQQQKQHHLQEQQQPQTGYILSKPSIEAWKSIKPSTSLPSDYDPSAWAISNALCIGSNVLVDTKVFDLGHIRSISIKLSLSFRKEARK